jgi:porin
VRLTIINNHIDYSKISEVKKKNFYIIFVSKFNQLQILIIIIVFLQCIVYPQSIFTNEHLTGNWFGLRDSLNKKGIMLNADYTSDVFSCLAGGLKRGTSYLDNIDITLTLDLEKLAGLENSSIFIYGLGNDGSNPDKLFGEAQAVSNISAPNAWKIYEAWIQSNIFNNHLSLLAGLYDLNSEFETLNASNLFINSSHGIGIAFSQTGRNGPSIFPVTSAGIRLKTRFLNSLYLQTVLLDGVPGDPDNPKGTHIIFNKNDGLLITVEAGLRINSSIDNHFRHNRRRLGRFSSDNYDAKYAFGFWKYTSQFKHLTGTDTGGNPVKSNDNIGMYFIAEQNIYTDTGNRKRKLTAFVRLEEANAEINRFAYYAGGGLVFDNPLLSGMNDEIGIAAAAAINGDAYRKLMSLDNKAVTGSELNIELTYFTRLLPWFSLKPDIQYIVDTNTNPLIPNGLAFDLRLGVSI